LILTACSTTGTAIDQESAARATFATAEVELVAEGGLGGMMLRSLVQGSGPTFLQTTHRICSVPSCQAAIDSASGALKTSAADSLFATIERQDPFKLKDDYGHTVGAADMFGYTLRVKIGDRTKTVHADDGTMPEPMRRISEALRATIAAARK
jgi:hypothetical protein